MVSPNSCPDAGAWPSVELPGAPTSVPTAHILAVPRSYTPDPTTALPCCPLPCGWDWVLDGKIRGKLSSAAWMPQAPAATILSLLWGDYICPMIWSQLLVDRDTVTGWHQQQGSCYVWPLPLSGAVAGGRLSWAVRSHSFFTMTYSLIAAWAS